MIITIAKKELLDYMREATQNLEQLLIEPIKATVEDSAEDDVWTFKLTYKITE